MLCDHPVVMAPSHPTASPALPPAPAAIGIGWGGSAAGPGQTQHPASHRFVFPGNAVKNAESASRKEVKEAECPLN